MYRDHQLSAGVIDVADRQSSVAAVINTRDMSGADSSNDDEGPSLFAIDEEETVDQFGNRMSMSR